MGTSRMLPGLAEYVVGNTVFNGSWAGGIIDPGLGWESTSQFNFGVDVTTLRNRLSIIANYYISRSYNLLYRQVYFSYYSVA